jgi:hypothetical protein
MKKNVKKFLDSLDKEALETDAYFGIRQYGGGADESFIYANKDGLLRYSISLLEGYLQVDEVIERSDESIISFPNSDEADWLDVYGNTLVDYIQLTTKKKSELLKTNGSVESNWKDEILRYLMAGIIIGVLVLAIIGFIALISWI